MLVAFGNGRLEDLLAQLRHLQLHLTSFAVKGAFDSGRHGYLPGLGCVRNAAPPAHGVGFCIQHRVQDLLNSARTNSPSWSCIRGTGDLNDFTQACAIVILTHGGGSPLLWD